jgi:hypothetical protein
MKKRTAVVRGLVAGELALVDTDAVTLAELGRRVVRAPAAKRRAEGRAA